VLDAFNELQVCTAYDINGSVTEEVPFQLEKQKPVPQYKNFEGWKTDISKLKEYDELPDKMKTYINFINDYLGIKVHYISNGPGREQLINA
jgi:adenylosuccinate synthase